MSTIKETETENTQEIGKLGNWKSITLNFVRPYFCLYPFNAPLEIKPENKVWVNANLSHIHWNFSVWSNYDKRLPDPEDQVACLSSLSLSCFRLLFNLFPQIQLSNFNKLNMAQSVFRLKAFIFYHEKKMLSTDEDNWKRMKWSFGFKT